MSRYELITGQVARHIPVERAIRVDGPVRSYTWPMGDYADIEIGDIIPDALGGVYVIGNRNGYAWAGYVAGLFSGVLLRELTLEFPSRFVDGEMIGGRRLGLAAISGEGDQRRAHMWMGTTELDGQLVWQSEPAYALWIGIHSDVRGRIGALVGRSNIDWEYLLFHPWGFVDARIDSSRLGVGDAVPGVATDHGGCFYFQYSTRIVKTSADLQPLWTAGEPMGRIGAMGDMAVHWMEGSDFMYARYAQAIPFSAKLNLGLYFGSAGGLGANVSLSSVGGAAPFLRQTVPVRSDRTLAFDLPVSGTLDVRIKVGHWLSTTYRALPIAESGVTNVPFQLVNGDVDGDDAIGLFDFLALRQAYGTRAGDALWNPLADLDGNGHVGIGDFAILRTNYGRRGD